MSRAASFFLLAAALVASLACARRAEITNFGCTWPPEVETAWWATDDVIEGCGYNATCWRDAVEGARRLRDRYPRELMAHRIFEMLVRFSDRAAPETEDVRKQVAAEYTALARRYPRNPAYPYLLARFERNRKQRRTLLEKAIALDPGFSWARQSRIRELYDKPTDADRKAIREDFEAIARACPDRPSVLLDLLWMTENFEAWGTYGSNLRNAAKVGPSPLVDLPTVWELEFRNTAPADHPAVRARIRSDLVALEALQQPQNRRWLAALMKGYELVGDAAAQRRVQDQLLARFPCSGEAMDIRVERYDEGHGGAPPENPAAAQKWYSELVAETTPWLRRCPAAGYLWQLRLSYLGAWEAAPAPLVDEAANRVLALTGDRTRRRVAGIIIDKNLRLDRVPGLIEKDRRQIEKTWARAQEEGLEGDALREAEHRYRSELFLNQILRVRLALAQRDVGAADLAVARLTARLDETRKVVKTEEDVAGQEAWLWYLRAEHKALAGRKGEALDDYGRSLEKSGDDQMTLKAARSLYVEIQGSDAGFDAWKETALQVSRTASEESARAVRRPLPDFELPDLAGKAWTKTALAGKAVLVNVWATWCGPCREELPSVQKLHETIRGRDFAVVTVNIDHNPGLVEPFMTKEKYTFPVLFGGTAAYEKWSPDGIPQNYVVDSRGMIVREQFGFAGNGAAWLESMERALRDAAAAGR